MTLSIRVALAAKADLVALRAYYLSEGGERLVSRLETVVDQAFETIAAFPFAWPIVADEFRRAVLPVFPLNVYYGVENDEVIVFAVEHERRDPNTVHRRVGAVSASD